MAKSLKAVGGGGEPASDLNMLVVAAVASQCVITGLLFSVIPPFYPLEAEARGLGPMQYGAVFAAEHLACLVSSPFFWWLTGRSGPKIVYVVASIGQILSGGLLFGLLAHVKDGAVFLGISVFLRLLYGISEAASACSSSRLLTSLYPERGASICWGLYSTFFGLGLILGPLLGSLLYTCGGFDVPFLTISLLGGVTVTLVALAVPNVDIEGEEDGERRGKREVEVEKAAPISKYLKTPSLWLPFVDTFCTQLGASFFESMGGPFAAREAGMSTGEVGAAFAMLAGAILAATLTATWTLEKTESPLFQSLYPVLGNVLMFLSMLLLCPDSTSSGRVYCACALLGTGFAVASAPGLARGQRAAAAAGFRRDLGSFSVIAAIWQFSYSSGNLAGPLLSGVGVEKAGFRSAAALLAGLYCACAVLNPALDFALHFLAAEREKRYSLVQLIT